EGGDTLWGASEFGVVRIIGDRAVQVPVAGLNRILVGNLSIAAAQGSLWVASSAGIASVPLSDLHRAADGYPVTIRPRVFDGLDGFPASRTARMTWRAILRGNDGRIWINCAGGLVVATSSLDESSATPRVMIEDAEVSGVKLTDGTNTPTRPASV